jgi:catalase
VLSQTDRDHLVENLVGHIGTDVTHEVQERAVGHWSKVDADLGARVAAGLGLDGTGNGAVGSDPGQGAAQGASVGGATEPARG